MTTTHKFPLQVSGPDFAKSVVVEGCGAAEDELLHLKPTHNVGDKAGVYVVLLCLKDDDLLKEGGEGLENYERMIGISCG